MAFLFQRPPHAQASPAFHHAPADTARVPEHIWNALLLSAEERIALSVARAGNKQAGSSAGLPSITCWGVLDRNVSLS